MTAAPTVAHSVLLLERLLLLLLPLLLLLLLPSKSFCLLGSEPLIRIRGTGGGRGGYASVRGASLSHGGSGRASGSATGEKRIRLLLPRRPFTLGVAAAATRRAEVETLAKTSKTLEVHGDRRERARQVDIGIVDSRKRAVPLCLPLFDIAIFV